MGTRNLSLSEKQKVFAAYTVWCKRTNHVPNLDDMEKLALAITGNIWGQPNWFPLILEIKALPGTRGIDTVLFMPTAKEKAVVAEAFLEIDKESIGVMEATE